MPTVGIVISNYNGWQDTVQCLQSLQKQTFTDFEIILLDDASPNDSVAQLGAHLPANTVFLPQSQNLGFAAAAAALGVTLAFMGRFNLSFFIFALYLTVMSLIKI